MKELLTRADPYNTVNIVDNEMHTYVRCNKQCDSCTNFAVTKSSFQCFATKRFYKNRPSTSCVSKNTIYVAFCLTCLKQGVRYTVDWKPRLWNYKTHIKKKLRSCSIANQFISLMFVVTQMIPQKILDLFSFIN